MGWLNVFQLRNTGPPGCRYSLDVIPPINDEEQTRPHPLMDWGWPKRTTQDYNGMAGVGSREPTRCSIKARYQLNQQLG